MKINFLIEKEAERLKLINIFSGELSPVHLFFKDFTYSYRRCFMKEKKSKKGIIYLKRINLNLEKRKKYLVWQIL